MSVLRDMSHVFSSMFGCRHERLSRLFTIQEESYMVCLNCGHQVFYSVDTMQRLSRRELQRRRSVSALPNHTTLPGAAEARSGPTLAA